MAMKTKITYAEAKQILENDEYSQFKGQTSTIHIVLSPKYLGHLQSGIADHLNLKLNLYNEIWGGAPVVYNNVKLLQRNSRIIEEQPYLHFDVQADFIVFSPKIGCTLKGIVNKTSKFHVGCLVHNCFNASIPKPKESVDSWIGSSFTVGTEFLFVVSGIFTNNDVLSMKGYLKDDGILSSKTKKRKYEETQSVQDEGFHSESPNRDIKRSSKKKRKHLISDKSLDASGIESLGTQPSSTDQMEDERGVKKKKKKSKHSLNKFEDIVPEDQLSGRVDKSTDETLLEKKLKKKKKKKKIDPDSSAMDLSIDIPSDCHQDFENSLHKKKKKKKHKFD
ncbi:hypothetical protein ACJMK2_020594 [Sinanodonta woodiana]|uniref:DNA-directed RNA polymerase I subunit RPA43 n=1 Tax=Sinanodonta woodiana TaxID=1069815 RepID=A0ABD3TZM9_SINWO